MLDDLLHQLVLAGEVVGDDALADARVRGDLASDAWANPSSAMTSMAEAMICARPGLLDETSAPFWPPGSFSDRMAKI
ncbi:hypothetical protein [Nonomuraea rubra]|uniref:hypothetical protein n=1 Tax=Nonomuraea rubra TaxID=46180 RepID=UPI0031EA0246